MPWPKLTQRQAILVRLAIYLPLIAYFGWGAYQTYRAEQDARGRAAASATSDGAAPELLGTPKEVTLPDGSTITVYELTEDEARAMGIDPDATRGPALSATPTPSTTSEAAAPPPSAPAAPDSPSPTPPTP